MGTCTIIALAAEGGTDIVRCFVPLKEAIAAADEAARLNYERNNYTFAPAPIHRADFISDKWCRVVNLEQRTDQGETEWKVQSVYAFIALQDYENKTLGRVRAGDIHKPASFKVPARHSRGTVFAADFSRTSDHYGPAYLR